MSMRKIFVCVLCALLTACFLPGQVLAAAQTPVIEDFHSSTRVTYTSPVFEDWGTLPYYGKECTGNKTAQASIDYLLRYYQDGAKFKGRGQCWGYAEFVRKFMGGGGKPKYYKKKNTHAAVVKALKGCRPGTHVRFASNKKGGGRAHSLVIFKFTSKEVFWADNNFGWDNRVHYYRGTPDDFQYSYKYLYFVHQPKKFKRQSKLKAAAAFDSKTGAISLCWPVTKKARRFDIYRSTRKSGGFQKVASTGARSYADKAASPGKIYYYKVKSGKKSSRTVSARQHLASPKVRFQVLENGRVRLSWAPVKGAAAYYIYSGESPDKRLATVKGTSWLAVDVDRDEMITWCDYYVVAASGNGGGNSAGSYIAVAGGPQQVQLRASWDSWENAYELTWPYAYNARYYEVYRADPETGSYQKIATVTDDRSYVDTHREAGKIYSYRIRSVMKSGQPDFPRAMTLYSGYSNAVTF